MPNHVHVLCDTFREHELGAVIKSWKTIMAKRINAKRGVRGRVWAHDYFDRYMRDDVQFQTAKRYIEMNPVSAGLCDTPKEWAFGSAGWS